MWNGEVGPEEAMSCIGSISMRKGDTDEAVVERGAGLLASGRKLSIEAFTLFAMYLDPDSPHAPAYHKYAHEHFNDADWASVARSARIGTPLRAIACDAGLRDEASLARSGKTVVNWGRFAASFGLDGASEPSEALKAAMAKLKERTS